MSPNTTVTTSDPFPVQQDSSPRPAGRGHQFKRELWLLLAMFLIAFALNFLVESHRMVLGFYTLPAIYSAYMYGRRHATLSAIASVFMVVLVSYFNPRLFMWQAISGGEEKWFDITVWGGILVVTAYAMGTLYERKEATLHELRESYHGILHILQHIASNDKYSQDHAYRVCVCATKIAERMELKSDQVEDIRAAALLHDIDRLGLTREVLYKSANLNEQECEEVRQRMSKGRVPQQPVGGSLRRVIPIVLAYQTACENGGAPRTCEHLPLEARIIAVADEYETLTSDPNSRLAPSEAIGMIVERAGVQFDKAVVDAFVAAFQYGRMQPVGAR
jgi:HD domain